MSISRVDHAAKNTFGYLVRVQRAGVLRTKFVSDSSAGGKRKALARARVVEAGLVTELEAQPKPKPRPSARNTSGVVGVSRSEGYWQAHWRDDDGRRRVAKFSVAKLGDEKAFRLAKRARKEGMVASA